MFTKTGVRIALESMPEAKARDCVIRGHCRTQMFAFPKGDLKAAKHMQPGVIFERSGEKATVVSDLRAYFEEESPFRHFAIDCSLSAGVDEVIAKRGKRVDADRFPLFLVLERETPCETIMDEGTCFVVDQGRVVGGQRGNEAIIACRAATAPWPKVDDDSEFMNTVVAAVKIVQDVTEVIHEVAEVSCFYDENGQAVYPLSMLMSASGSVTSPLAEAEVESRVTRAHELVEGFVVRLRDDDERIANLVHALRLEQIDTDHYRRVWYLCLFEAIEAVLTGRNKHEFHQRHRTYRGTIGHSRAYTMMDMGEFARLQRDALAELRRMFLGE